MILKNFRKNLLFKSLILLIIISPVFFGGNTPIAWSSISLASGVLLFTWSLKNIFKEEDKNSISLRYTYLIIFPFLLVIIWAILQITINSPKLANPLWIMAGEVLGEDRISLTITIDKIKSVTELMKWLAYGAIFWLALQSGRDRNNAKAMFLAISLSSALIALYGLVMHFFGIEKILWVDKEAYQGSVTATFINRNSYATYCGVGIIISLSLLFSMIFKNIRYQNIHDFYKQLANNFTNSKTLLYFSATILLSAALILSNSRAGIICSFIAVISFISLFSFSNSVKNYRLVILGTAFLLICIFAALFSSGGDITAQRFSKLGNEIDMRHNIYSTTIDAVKDFALLGSGLGSFENIFSIYKDSRFPFGFTQIINHAHNTYLEVMLELGIPAFLLLTISLITMIIICFKGIINRKQDIIFPTASLAVSILIWTHALFDFSVEMPAIAILYTAIMGIGCANSFSSREGLGNKKLKNGQFWCKITNFLIITISIITILLSSYFSFINIARAGIDQEVISLRARKPFTSFKLEKLIAKQNYINSFYQSGNSLNNLAICQIILANYYGYFSSNGEELLKSAQINLRNSLIKSPANSETWFKLAYTTFLLEGSSQTVANAIYMSTITMPYNYRIIKSRLVLSELVWDFFNEEQKEILKKQIIILQNNQTQ